PTGHWQRPDLSGGVLVTADLPLVTPDEAVTLEYRLPSRMPLEGVASIDEPTSAVPSASLDVLTTTVRMPRAAPKSSEAEPVRPTACIQVVSERGIASAGGTLASFRRQGEEVTLPNGTPCVLAAPIVDRRCPVPSEEHRREHSLASNFRERNPAFDAMAFPRGNPPQALALPPALRPQPAKARPSYATPRPKQSFRLRFATTLGRDRKIVASVMIAAALSVSAFVAQAVRAWPYIATIARGVSHPPSPHVVAGRLATKLTAIPKAK
ncbi:MAG TPA: hypothetical protein VNW92_15180, partial [Polyangiaceae bacterium]|nr:hypothetical protein [Polyangiaceae bacterium]